MLEPLVLNDAVEAKDGLIVDTQQGRLAFRHHRTPTHVGQGSEWTEDLLFLEPATECVNLNLSIEFKIPEDGGLGSTSNVSLTLIDNGGFADLVLEYPNMNVTTSQEDPQLAFRAYKAAWLVNVYSMLIMNITRPSPDAFSYLNSEKGQRFELDGGFGNLGSASAVNVDTLFSGVVDPASNTKSNFTSVISNETINTGIYDNPFNITSNNYTDISLLCEGAGGRDLANSSNILVKCGLVYGAARRTDGVQSLIFEAGDVYQRPLYSCASTTRASIKTVSFKFNATEGNGVQALAVQNITDKIYSENDGPNPPPLWGIETVDFTLADIQQLWGLISDTNKDAANMTAIRAPQLHLPGYTMTSGASLLAAGYEFIPGSTATSQALAGMYGSFGGGSSGGYDYTGRSNLALFQKWQALSANETGVARMLSIVWADLAANAMTGTRGWGTGNVTNASGNTADAIVKRQSGNGDGEQTVMVPVRLYEKKIRYHWVYGIPAFMAVALFVTVMAGSCCCMVVRRGGPKRTRYYLNHLSAGRLLAEQRYPGTVDRQVDTSTWVKLAGKHPVSLDRGVNAAGGGAAGAAAVMGTPGGSPYVGEEGGLYEGKPGMNASATELSNLNSYRPGSNGYSRMHQ